MELDEDVLDIDLGITNYWPNYLPVPSYVEGLNSNIPVVPTLKMLLSHTAGIQHYKGPNDMVPPKADINDSDVNTGMQWAVDHWVDEPFTALQSAYSYSTFGINLACVVMEKAYKVKTGRTRSFDQLFMQKIGNPFGLNSMVPDYAWVDNPMQTLAYKTDGTVDTRNGETDVSYKLCGGGYSSSANDMAKYARALMVADFTFTSADRALMWQDYTSGTGNYGLGWKINSTRTSTHHWGKQPGAKNLLQLWNSKESAIVIMTNTEELPNDDIRDLRNNLTSLFGL